MSKNGPMHDNGVDVLIGCRHFQNPLAFSGLIDDARIYNRALDATEVQSLVTPGTVVITSPATDQTFLPGEGVTITADVFNFSAPVTKVDFYEGSTLIGTATQAPYSVVYYNPFIDNSRHYIVAVATDTARFPPTAVLSNAKSIGGSQEVTSLTPCTSPSLCPCFIKRLTEALLQTRRQLPDLFSRSLLSLCLLSPDDVGVQRSQVELLHNVVHREFGIERSQGDPVVVAQPGDLDL